LDLNKYSPPAYGFHAAHCNHVLDALQWIIYQAVDVFEEFRFEAGPMFMVFQNWRGKNPGQPRVMEIGRGIYMLFGTDEK